MLATTTHGRSWIVLFSCQYNFHLQYHSCNNMAFTHYLDDFITVGRRGSSECEFNCKLISDRLGVPLTKDKCEGLVTRITFLGIEIDSLAMELRLPSDKLHRLQDELKGWRNKKTFCKARPTITVGSTPACSNRSLPRPHIPPSLV